MRKLSYQDLDSEDRALVDAAREARATAYAPYSGVTVGAALRTLSGRIITGSNVENAAYGSTICAERMAAGRANAEGERGFAAVAVTARGGSLAADRPVSPCGACRQVLYELGGASGQNTRVIMAAPETDDVAIATIAELLPFAFGPVRGEAAAGIDSGS